MIAGAVATLVATACGAEFLGAPLPASCTRSRADCQSELYQRAWQDINAVDDPALLAYVRGVLARLVRVSTLRESPDVSLTWYDDGDQVGRHIRIGVNAIARFESEAELAATLAHQLVHIEAHCDVGCAATGTDDESLADERALTLMSRAGYPPVTFATELARHDDGGEPDAEHLPIAERVQRARLLAAQLPAGGNDRRAALLAAIDGVAIEPSTMVFIGGRSIVTPSARFQDGDPATDSDGHPLDPAHMMIVLPSRDIAFGAPNLGLPSGSTGSWNIWPVGRATAAAIAAELVNTHVRTLAVGNAIVGHSPPAQDPTPSLGNAIHSAIEESVSIDEDVTTGHDAAVAVIDTPGGGLVVTYNGAGGTAALERWLAWFRRPTAAERTWRPRRIRSGRRRVPHR